MKEMSVDDVIEELIVLDLLCKREKTIMEIENFWRSGFIDPPRE